jgi:hypothetical protein
VTLESLLDHLRAVAVEYRQSGAVCCAQITEQYAARLAEAIERNAA